MVSRLKRKYFYNYEDVIWRSIRST